MAFTFRQLEIFVEAARDGNFRKTADRIGISQPAISKQVRSLEISLGKSLFERTRGASARLSEHGQSMLLSAQEMLAKRQKFDPAHVEAETLRLRVITGDYLLDHVIKPALPDLYERFPQIVLEFQVINSREEILEQIRSSKADLALFTSGVHLAEGDGVETIAVIRSSLYAAHAIADAVGDDPAAISAAPFILPLAGPQAAWVMSTLERVGITPSLIAARSQFGDVLANMVRDGRGIGLLFDEHAGARLDGRARRLPIDLAPAYRMSLAGEKASVPQARGCIDFLKGLLRR